MDPVIFWNQLNSLNPHTCPNVSFFRFLGYSDVIIENKNIFEIGFGGNNGADLIELKKRGANVYGSDINKFYIDEFSKYNPDVSVSIMNAGIDQIPFNINFDIIYHRDLIYYLSDSQIEFHFFSAYKNLINGGKLIFQFIENDLFINQSILNRNSLKLDLELLKNANNSKMYKAKNNPLRKLDIDCVVKSAINMGFKLKGTKTLIESYTPDETVYRVNRYVHLEK